MFSSLFGFSKESPTDLKEFVPQFLMVMGDMNFRVTKTYSEAMRIINSVRDEKLRGHELQKKINLLLEDEQLSKALKTDRKLRKIKEKLITFLPTFKMDEKSDNYAHEKQRRPSWYHFVIQDGQNSDLLRRSRQPFHVGVQQHAAGLQL